MRRLPDELVEIASFDYEEDAHDYGLVVLSMGTGYWVEQGEDEQGVFFSLLVEPGMAEAVLHQFDLYERESVNWPPEDPELPEEGVSFLPALLWVTLMTVCYSLSLRWPDLFERGKLSAEAVVEGEYYRTFTALLLHGDIGHLAGNLLFGAVFLHLVARHLGGLLAWLGVLVAGTAGNYLNAILYYPAPHYSVGASTAVFGAIGLLVALPVGFGLRHAGRRFLRVWALPIIVGLVFLAWFGTGTERTDTSAHLMGFCCGLPLGVLGGFFVRRRERPAQLE